MATTTTGPKKSLDIEIVVTANAAAISIPTKPTLRQLLDRKSLLVAWIGLILTAVINYLDGVTANTYTPYALSNFDRLSYEGAILAILSVTGLAIQPPLAVLSKRVHYSDIMSAAVVICTVGAVVAASSRTLAAYLAGFVLFVVGVLSSKYMVLVFSSELSSIRYRMLSLTGVNFPALISLLSGAPLAEAVLENLGWRWGFGIWAILVPACTLTLIVVLFFARCKGGAQRTLHAEIEGTSLVQALWRADPIGVLLLTGGACAFLLPISLEQGGFQEYASVRNLIPTVIGFVALVFFVIFEVIFAPYPLAPRRVLINKSVWGPMFANTFLYLSMGLIDTYSYVYLIVMGDTGISTATYISTLIMTVSAVAGVFWGLAASWIDRPKWLMVLTLAIYLLGCGLLYGYYDAATHFGVIVGANLLRGLGYGGSLFAIVLAQATTTPEDIPIITALYMTFCNLGSAISGAVAGSLWTSLLPQNLRSILPDELKPDAMAITNDITEATSYEWGSEIRDLINDAYGKTFRTLVLGGVVLAALAFLSGFLSNDVEVSRSVEGTVPEPSSQKPDFDNKKN